MGRKTENQDCHPCKLIAKSLGALGLVGVYTFNNLSIFRKLILSGQTFFVCAGSKQINEQ